jgi:hypothetical protein
MARNTLAGSKRGTSRTARFYQNNPEARKKRDEYATKYHSTKKRKKYRAVLQAINRTKGTHGNGDNMDEAHVSRKKTRKQSQSKNRADKKRQFFK